MNILSAQREVIAEEQTLLIEHNGEQFKWVCWFGENSGGYDWFKDGKAISEPDWASDYDFDELYYQTMDGAK